MVLKGYTIYDNAAKAFFPPFFSHNNALAIRSFSDLANDASSVIHKHSSEFSLFCIGEFDDSVATFVAYTQAENLGLASKYRETVYKDGIESVIP